jgi:tetratricopeptide (TPR) repeat protein
MLCLLLFASVLPAQTIPWWKGTWDEAFEEAAHRNVPVLVACIQEDEEANDRIVAGLHIDGDFVKAAESRFIPVIASPSTHESRVVTTGEDVARVCGRFGTVTCSVHRRQEAVVRALLWEDGMVKTPAHIVLLPNKTEVGRLIDVHSTSAYLGLVQKAQATLGRGISAGQYRDGTRLLATARATFDKGEISQAWEALDSAAKILTGTPLGKRVEDLREHIRGLADRTIAHAIELAQEGKHLDALRALETGSERFQKTDRHKDLKQTHQDLSASQEGRVAARILRGEQRARPSFEQGKIYEEQRDYVRSAQAYYRALAMAPESEVERTARATIDRFRADPDIAALLGPVVADGESAIALARARILARERKRDEARVLIEKTLAEFPESRSATTLRGLLKGLQ